MTTLHKNADFLEHAYRTVWMAAGASEEHAAVVARSVSMADRMRKYRQGLPVLEYLFLALEVGNLDIKAVPSIVSDGSSWVLYDGNRSSGHWALTLATKAAIVKAREVGVAIGMARNHGDTGMCYAYTSLAVEQDMLAMATNNTGPQVSPWGGMEQKLPASPFCAAAPGGEESPLITDISMLPIGPFAVSQAWIAGTRLEARVLADPDTGELTNDPGPYFTPLEGYSRIGKRRAALTFPDPRQYALNVFTEMLSSIIVPGSFVTPELKEISSGEKSPGRSSFVLVIDPSHFDAIEDVKARSDRYVRAVKSARRLPGVDEIFLPGERGLRAAAGSDAIEIHEHHWKAFSDHATRYGIDLEQLHENWRRS